MAFLEWRRFSFFDLKPNEDSGKIAKALSGTRVTATTSGHGLFIIGDSNGFLHLVSKTYEIKTFRAYERHISLLQQSKQSSFLVSIGEDETGINPVIKVWNLDKSDRQGNPVCLRITRASIPNKAVVPTCLALNDNFTYMAVGFADGSILIYRGDITRERTSKQNLIKDGLTSITGLAFRSSGKTTHLYVATVSSIEMYEIPYKDKDNRTHLDDFGCALRCSVLAETFPDSHFMVARNDAVYCYTNGVRGPCYAVDGDKIQLEWFRNYLVIIAKDNRSTPRITSSTTSSNLDAYKDGNILTVLDIQNNFIVFTSPMKDVSTVFIEWGSFYILSSDNTLTWVVEKDLQSKLALLFKKNLYDVAIRIAKSQQYDAEGLMEIFRQYGDHLYSKSDHKGAIEQYIKTIGKLEPSFVIRKYLDSQQVENLTTYLQALHKEGAATGDHTTLLLNCYTKLNKHDLLKEFIMTKDREVDFDVEVAIEVCRNVSAEDALMLAEKHNLHSWYLTIQIEDQKNFSAALDYIGKLEFDEAEYMMKKYGITLIENMPKETTQFLKRLCTDYRPSNKPLVDQNMLDGYNISILQKSAPEEFIHYFLNNSERLVEFLEHLIQTSSKWSCQVYTTLLEHYIQVWSVQTDPHSQLQYEQKIMRLLESSEAMYDKLQALILCKASNFRAGILYLYEQNKMYQAILNYHVAQKDYSAVLVCCRRFGHQEPGLWVQALWAVSTHTDLPHNLLDEILAVIEKDKLLSPMMVIDALSHSPAIQIGHLRGYLNKVLQAELSVTEQQKNLIEKYTQQTEKVRNTIKDIQNKPMVFLASRCCACNKQLEIPSIHFLCQHSYHQHCFQSFAENENECPTCHRENKQILDAINSQEQSRDLHEAFHSQLERADDGFSLVTDYLGRGVFTKLTNQTNVMRLQSLTAINTMPSNKPKEERVKPQFSQQPINPFQEKSNNPWMRDDYKMSLEANLMHQPRVTYPAAETPVSERITASLITNKVTALNPFEEDEDSMNPFANDEPSPPQNPFEEGDDEDDYDKNLNPFAT